MTTQRKQLALPLFEQAATLSSQRTADAREQAARLIAQGNAILRGRPAPAYAKVA